MDNQKLLGLGFIAVLAAGIVLLLVLSGVDENYDFADTTYAEWEEIETAPEPDEPSEANETDEIPADTSMYISIGGEYFPLDIDGLDLSLRGLGNEDIIPLRDMENLVWLNLDDNNITDISPLEGMGLTWLNLGCNEIEDFSPLTTLTELTHLDIHNTGLSDLTLISSLPALEVLNINDNQVSDISLLVNTNITALLANDNQITDISPLAELENLMVLTLTNNQITDIAPLANLTAIMDLSDNPITDWQPLSHILFVEGRPRLPGLVVYALSEDMFTQAQEVGLRGNGAVIFEVPDMGWNPFLMQAGDPTFEIVEGPYGNAIFVSERTNTWDALDVALTQWGDVFLNFEESDYDFFVRGRNASDSTIHFAIGAMDGPWAWLAFTEVAPQAEFTLEAILSLDAFEAIGGSEQFLERGFRLLTGCLHPYIIYEAKITRR